MPKNKLKINKIILENKIKNNKNNDVLLQILP